MLMLLTAVDEGLGACFFGSPGELVREEFGIPDDYTPIGTVAIGYPAANDRPSRSVAGRRRDLESVVHRGGW
jgi:nitroreductase